MSLLTNPWFQVGQGLLASSGPSLSPINPWSGIGQGLMNAQNAQTAEQESAYRQMQMQQEQTKMETAKRQQQYIEQLATQEADPKMAAMARVAPDEYIKRKLAGHASAELTTAGALNIPSLPPDTPVQVKKDADGNVTGYDPITIPSAPKDDALVARYKYAVDHDKYQGTFQEFMQSAGTKKDVSPFSSPVQTDQGLFWGNQRTQELTPMLGPNGEQLRGAQYDPSTMGAVAQAKGAGLAEGTAQGTAAAEVPAAQISADRVHGLVEGLRNHPGLPDAVGGMKGLVPPVPGTEQGDFINALDQATNNAFMEARTALKGAGQITDYEGKKAESAIARMKRSTSRKEFMSALDDFDSAIESGMKKLKARAGQKETTTSDGWSIKVKK